MFRKKAFTLAEVLITLVVIGVVASMTVPVIVTNHKKTENAARIKKFFNQMTEVVERAEMDYDLHPSKWGVRVTPQQYFDRYIEPYIKYTSTNTNTSQTFNNNPGLTAYLEDGSYLRILIGGLASPSSSTCISNCLSADPSRTNYYCHVFCMDKGCTTIFYDVNGDQGPNRHGADIHRFYVCGDDMMEGMAAFDVSDGVATSNVGAAVTRQQAINQCRTNAYYGACTRLLKLDNWEFKKDYPIRS